jgi:uncharacterized RDD family membrane protein YckC
MSVPGIFRRLAALCIDWLLSAAVAFSLTPAKLSLTHAKPVSATADFWITVVFAAEIYLLTAFVGTTLGKRLLGMRVIRTDGHRVGPGRVLLRTVLLLLGIPPLVSDRDVRGLHDRAADTIVVRI